MDTLGGGGLEGLIVKNMNHPSIAMVLSGAYQLQPEIDASNFYELLAERLNEENEGHGRILLDKEGNPARITGQELMRISRLYSGFNRVIEPSDPDYAQQGMLILNFMMAAPKMPKISAALLEYLHPTVHARMYEATNLYAQQRR